eukprot:6472554-Lingulodinium_polyedra.AAC.1
MCIRDSADDVTDQLLEPALGGLGQHRGRPAECRHLLHRGEEPPAIPELGAGVGRVHAASRASIAPGATLHALRNIHDQGGRRLAGRLVAHHEHGDIDHVQLASCVEWQVAEGHVAREGAAFLCPKLRKALLRAEGAALLQALLRHQAVERDTHTLGKRLGHRASVDATDELVQGLRARLMLGQVLHALLNA